MVNNKSFSEGFNRDHRNNIYDFAITILTRKLAVYFSIIAQYQSFHFLPPDFYFRLSRPLFNWALANVYLKGWFCLYLQAKVNSA